LFLLPETKETYPNFVNDTFIAYDMGLSLNKKKKTSSLDFVLKTKKKKRRTQANADETQLC
jgi:hypothetical protein